MPVELKLTVSDAHGQAIAGTAVDVWHCDATGLYSGFAEQGDEHRGSAAANTHSRGRQTAGADQRAPARPEWAAMTLRAARFLVASLAMAAAMPSLALDVVRYRGMCDASAAVALGADHFVVANDEDNLLRIYRHGRPEPVSTLPLAGFLGTADDDESDLEAAAQIGNRIYWISSHARNRNGKARPARQRFFATDLDDTASPPALRAVGRPVTGLLGSMLAAPAYQSLGLAAAATRAPEAPGGFNIEGLAATSDGRLLIGLRSPLSQGRALLLPLENPQQALDGQAVRWGAPIMLALGGRGVRSIEASGGGFLVVAGPTADEGSFALYRWSGQPQDAPVPQPAVDLGSLRPEALFALPGSAGMQLLSDDGGVRGPDGVECKKRSPAERAFRSLRFIP